MSKKGVYKLNFDCGRMGELTGVFIATDDEVNMLVESKIEVYFGEVLGKHSEVYGTIDEGDVSLITDNPEVVYVVEEYDLTNGINPFDYTAINVETRYLDMQVSVIIKEMLEGK